MSTVGIVCEYNPFHKGHEHQIQQARRATGADHIICFMSGNFLQRGTPAITDKYTRTAMALSCGVDAVFEIPFVFATASARDYATAAISMMNALENSIDYIVFGAETDNLELLRYIADIIICEPAQLSELIRKNVSGGLSYGAARARALTDYLYSSDNPSNVPELSAQELGNILSCPNNILAIEYLCALKQTHSTIKPVLIQRTSDDYKSTDARQDICSASAIREIISIGSISDLKRHIPAPAYSILESAASKTFPIFDDSLTYLLNSSRLLANDDLSIVDMDQDLANRFKKLDINMSYADTISSLGCKNFTSTHIQRAVIHYIFQLNTDDYLSFKENNWIPYIKLLGIKRTSSHIVSAFKKKAAVPIITKTTEIYNHSSPTVSRLFAYDVKASQIYSNMVFNKYGFNLKNDFQQSIIVL